MMLKLKLQYFGHLMQRADSLEKTLMLWKIEGGRRRGWQDEMVGWHHRLNGHEFEQSPGDCERQGTLACCSPWGHKESDRTYWLNNKNNLPLSVTLVFMRMVPDKQDKWFHTPGSEADPTESWEQTEGWGTNLPALLLVKPCWRKIGKRVNIKLNHSAVPQKLTPCYKLTALQSKKTRVQAESKQQTGSK